MRRRDFLKRAGLAGVGAVSASAYVNAQRIGLIGRTVPIPSPSVGGGDGDRTMLTTADFTNSTWLGDLTYPQAAAFGGVNGGINFSQSQGGGEIVRVGGDLQVFVVGAGTEVSGSASYIGQCNMPTLSGGPVELQVHTYWGAVSGLTCTPGGTPSVMSVAWDENRGGLWSAYLNTYADNENPCLSFAYRSGGSTIVKGDWRTGVDSRLAGGSVQVLSDYWCDYFNVPHGSLLMAQGRPAESATAKGIAAYIVEVPSNFLSLAGDQYNDGHISFPNVHPLSVWTTANPMTRPNANCQVVLFHTDNPPNCDPGVGTPVTNLSRAAVVSGNNTGYFNANLDHCDSGRFIDTGSKHGYFAVHEFVDSDDGVAYSWYGGAGVGDCQGHFEGAGDVGGQGPHADSVLNYGVLLNPAEQLLVRNLSASAYSPTPTFFRMNAVKSDMNKPSSLHGVTSVGYDATTNMWWCIQRNAHHPNNFEFVPKIRCFEF